MTTLKNNAMSLNLSLSEVLNNFVISFSGYSQRTKSIIIMNNTMTNMNDASEGFFDVLNNSPESINFDNNLITNCSPFNDMIILLTFDNITTINNIFIHQKLKIH
jgi:hypothetical protein